MKKLISNIVTLIVRFYDPDKIILFGSHAKGTAKAGSDIDLAVIKFSELPMETRGRFIENLFSSSVIGIDFHFYTPEEFEELKIIPYTFEHMVDLTGKIIYEKMTLRQ